jgi:LysM repeat protein
MPISHKSPYRGHVLGAIGIVCIGLMALGARQQGWLGAAEGRKTRATADTAKDDVPGPDEELAHIPVEFAEISPENETIENPPLPAPARRKKRLRPSEWILAGAEQEETAKPERAAAETTAARSAVVAANFEEDAPPAPQSDDDLPPKKREPAKSDRSPVARKSTETATGAARGDDDEGSRKKPLMSGEKIQALIDDGNYIEAQKGLSQWYWQKPETRDKIASKLNKLSQALYFAPQPHYYDPYVVKSGDQLRVIGQHHKLSWEYLAKLNQVDARKIRAGQKLKVVPGPFGAVVNVARFELVVHLNGSYVKRYRVGVGIDGTTPIGSFTVKNKLVDPTYYGPDGVISKDDPNNPLGERWIDIGDSFGIHGTNEPDSIGKNESRGCVRMLNDDVEEVYDFLVVGSEVKIVGQ